MGVALAVAIVYWPGLSADWLRDDFLGVAFSRMLGSPWSLFLNDHFHLPGAHFRPLGYAALWLNQALLGNHYIVFSLVEGAIHAGVAVALYRLLRVGLPSSDMALLGALLFAVHPASVSAALWISDRVGHLAALFTLVALRAAVDYRSHYRPIHLVTVLVSVLASMASKEVGLIAVPAVSVLWLLRGHKGRAGWRAQLLLWSTVAVYFVWRWLVLGTPASSNTADMPLHRLMLDGLGVWLAGFPGYASFWVRLDLTQQILLGLSVTFLAAVLGYQVARSVGGADTKLGPFGPLLAVGLCLVFLPGVLQAPIAFFNAVPLNAEISAVEAAMQARLYYMSLAGIAILVAVFLSILQARAPHRLGRVGLRIAMGCVVAMIANIGWHTVDDYRVRTKAIGTVAHAAVAALARYELPAQGCRVYFLGVRHAPEWGIYVSMDSIVKALSPDLGRVRHCLIHSETPTFVYLLPAGVAKAEGTTPYQILQRRLGGALPPRPIGGLEMVYLSRPEPFIPDSARDSLFLDWDGVRFVDVTAEVLVGRRKMDFQ